MSLYGKIGESNPSALLAEADGVRKISVAMAPGNGIAARGAICYKDAATGMYKPAALADIIDANQLVVLDETVDTDESTEIGMAAAAYREATLIREKVTITGEDALTRAAEATLRKQGLYLSPNNDSPDFDNEA